LLMGKAREKLGDSIDGGRSSRVRGPAQQSSDLGELKVVESRGVDQIWLVAGRRASSVPPCVQRPRDLPCGEQRWRSPTRGGVKSFERPSLANWQNAQNSDRGKASCTHRPRPNLVLAYLTLTTLSHHTIAPIALPHITALFSPAASPLETYKNMFIRLRTLAGSSSVSPRFPVSLCGPHTMASVKNCEEWIWPLGTSHGAKRQVNLLPQTFDNLEPHQHPDHLMMMSGFGFPKTSGKET